MRRIYLVAVLAIACISSFAQSSDPEAKKILDAVSNKFKTFKAVQSNFTLQIEDAKGKIQGTKKGVVFMKGDKYRITITGQEIFSDGKNIWTYDQGANEVTITSIDPTGSGITPQKLFTTFYDKDFLYKLNGETKTGNKTVQEIELTPVDKTKAFFKVLVYIDKARQSIMGTKVFQKTGDRYTYTVSGLKTNTSLPDNLFVFDAKNYPKVEVVDLR